MFKKFKAMFAFMTAMFTDSTLLKDGQLNLTAEQHKQLQDSLGEKVKLDEVVTAMNQELADLAKAEDDNNDGELQDLRKKAQEMLLAHGLSQEDSKQLIENPSTATDVTEKEILKGLTTSMAEMDKKIKKLMEAPEDDDPEATGSQKKVIDMKHSKTHLFGTGHKIDAFEGRNWNKRAAGLATTPTDFAASKVDIETLKGDVDLYYRENPTVINSLHRDLLGLPTFWKTRTNVTDKVADGNIVSGEISQPRKAGWLPKNKQAIRPEESQIFPVHIDIELAGYYLQEIEASWLSFLNNEGSQPFKMTFVRFLLQELDKKARLEDRKVAINGVHVATPDDATIAGNAINRGDGLLIKLWRALYIDGKYSVAQIGAPTEANIVDYVKDVIEKNVPEEVKNDSGLVFYLSPSWLRKHRERKRVLFGTDTNYKASDLVEIEGYENYVFQPLRDLEGTDYMFITFNDNIELMENIPGEKSMYNFDTLKRILFIFADYKWGIRIKHIGNKLKAGDPDSFKVQTVWTNGLSPFKSDYYVRLYDDATGDIALPYSNITLTDDWATDIANITGAFDGQIVRVKGNTSVAKLVVDTGNITLTGNVDFDISTGGTLILRAAANGDLTEVKRTAAPPTLPIVDVEFSGTAIDADSGYVFNYTGGAAAFTAITNGVEGQEIVINGGAGGTLTINDVVGNIEVASAAALLNAADNITLTMVDGVWTEVARTI